MKTFITISAFLALAGAAFMANQSNQKPVYNKLTPAEERVIIYKGTEAPFTGKYLNNKEAGTYVCKRCGAPLYRSSDKFNSECGWPSFDDEIKGAVKRVPDIDGMRTEIICANCGAHLGHVFLGEHMTAKDTRHCVNSISLVFIPAGKPLPPVINPNAKPADPNKAANKTEKAYFAGGCFWGVDYWLRKEKGVINVTAGYMGGTFKNPTYEQVCTGKTGHAETVEVEFDPNKVSYETLAKLFFNIHDPTELNRQGPDIGYQYRSVVFYANDQQKDIATRLIGQLRLKGYNVVTTVEKAGPFYKAEEHHQNYYGKNGKLPYCHIYTKRF
jgi:peptide methionine sulfoxide reductase msrA/msrB